MKKKNAYIQGAGLLSFAGRGLKEAVDLIRQKESKPQLVDLELVPQESTLLFFPLPDLQFPGQRERFNFFIDDVIEQAVAEANLTQKELEDIQLFIGSSSMDISISEEQFTTDIRDHLTKHPIRESGYGKISDYVRKRFGIKRTAYTYNTACTSSINAYIHASFLIETGKIHRALILGLEVKNNITLFGFNSLRLISPDGIKPFDKNRNGTILGEGSSAVILGSEPPSHSNPLHLVSASNSCDTYSVTGADPSGSSTKTVMERALKNAGLNPSDIQGIKAHGTSSSVNDQAEASGMISLFEDRIPPTTVIKPYIGHTLGACGTNELLIINEFLKEGKLPAPPKIKEPDPELNHFQTISEDISVSSGYFMLNYYGFGGNNTSTIFSNLEN